MSITLEIDNSYSRITGLEASLMRKLRDLLSYEIDSSAAYFSNNKFNTRKYLIDNRGGFGTGLLDTVVLFLTNEAVKYKIINKRVIPKNKVSLKGKFEHRPYKAQQAAVNVALREHQATLSLPTGSGKSMVIAMIINELKLKTLIVVPTIELKNQLTASLTSIFGTNPYITVENIDSTVLTKDNNFDILIIDEAHRSASATYQKLNKVMWNKIYYRYFLTATAFRTNPNEDLLFQSIAGKVKFELTYKYAVKHGFVLPVEAFYVELPKIPNDCYTWQQVYSELVVNNQARNEIIAHLISQLSSGGYSTLCLVKEIKHGNILSEMTGVPFTNGQDENSRQFIKQISDGRIKAIIGTEGTCAEGIDTRAVEFVIISALGKSKGAFLQKCGRAVRKFEGKESAKIIIFKDKSHRMTLSHFNAQKKILLDYYGVEVVKLDI